MKQLESQSGIGIGSTPELFRKRYTSKLTRWNKIMGGEDIRPAD